MAPFSGDFYQVWGRGKAGQPGEEVVVSGEGITRLPRLYNNTVVIWEDR